jgi:hypothetical protein
MKNCPQKTWAGLSVLAFYCGVSPNEYHTIEVGKMDNNNQTDVDWDNVLSDITDLYRNIEKESLTLPVFSLKPVFISIWNFVKFYIFFILDFLLIPMNVIIFVRNLFPGHWRYRFFSWRYIKYVGVWIWRGEIPFLPLGVIGSLVRLILAAHIKNRLTEIKKHIYVDETLSEEKRELYFSQLDKQIEHWTYPGVLNIALTYVFPLSGLAIEGYRFKFPGQLPEWSSFIGVTLLGYTLGFVVTAFMVKRAIMLGASGQSAAFPGAIEGAGKYRNEKSILSSAKISKSEFPWDIVLAFIAIPIGYLTTHNLIQLYHLYGLDIPPQDNVKLLIQGAVLYTLLLLSKYRRKVAGRE